MGGKKIINDKQELALALGNRLQVHPFLGAEWRLIDGGYSDARLLELKVQGEAHQFELVLKRRLKARDLRSAQSLVGRTGGRPLMFVTVDLSSEMVAKCHEAGVCGLGINGRLFIHLPGLYIDCLLPPLPMVYASDSSKVNPFTPKSSRLARALLSAPDREWKIHDLAKAIGMGHSRVAEVLRTMSEEEWVVGSRGDWRVADAGRLLEAWQKADSWGKRTTILQYVSLDHSLHGIATTLQQSLQRPVVFTQWFAANLRLPYTDSPVVSAYCSAPLSTEEQARSGLEEVESGGRLWLVLPKDEGVYQFTRSVGEFTLVSDVQIYLDLLHVGMRGPDHARELRQWEGFCR